MTPKSYTEFKHAMGMRESSNNYSAKNQYGFLGKYQFGMPRLYDLGLTEKTDSGFVWPAFLSEKKFLDSKELQERAFDVHVAKYRVYVLSRYSRHLHKEILQTKLTISGAIACCHLLGPGGLAKFVKGVDASDANGTKASSYISLFQDYVIPTDLPMNISQKDIKLLLAKIP